jgi:hypothetical protein
MTKTTLVFLAALFCALSITSPVITATQRGPVDTGPGTLTAARKYLEGRWRLLSYEVRLPGREPITLTGDGTLTYDAFGNLSIEVHVDPKTAKSLEAGGIRTKNGVLVTSGRTAINLQARSLTFLLDGQPALGTQAGPFALNRPRYWEIDGNKLTLTTKGDDGEPTSIGRWEKAAP